MEENKVFNSIIEDDVIEDYLVILPKQKIKLSGFLVIKKGIEVQELGELYIENSELYFTDQAGIICKGKIIAINSKFDANEIFWKNITFSGKLANNSELKNCTILNGRGISLEELIKYSIGKNSIWSPDKSNYILSRKFGGAILIVSVDKIYFENCKIENCNADIGGAIANTNNNFDYSQITFNNCIPDNIFEISNNRFTLSIKPKEIFIGVNENIDIQANVFFIDGSSNYDFIWKSENESIATVTNNGKVFGKSVGTVNINAIFNFNNIEYIVTSKVNVIRKLLSIEINPNQLSLFKGDTYKLIAIGKFSDGSEINNFEWESSDESICSVSSEGVVTAHNPGNVIIRAISKEFNKSNSINLYIKNLLSVETNINQVNLLEGDKYKLRAIAKFDDGSESNNFEWESSDESICSVNSEGVVTAHNPGNVFIRAINKKYNKYTNINIYCKSYIDMIFVEGGIFEMGDTTGIGYPNEKPVHKVTLSSFYISKYLVSQKEYKAVTGINPSFFVGDYLPVENISWYDAVNYCNLLSKKENIPVAYNENGELIDMYGRLTNDLTKVKGYRLLTEAEWEYAAKGGNKSSFYRYSGSNDPDEIAWYYNNANSKTHEIGTKKPNELGIYDMSGNVWEWINDWYDQNYYYKTSQNNPYNFTKSNFKVIRGGSWCNSIRSLIVSFREFDIPRNIHSNLGFRFCRSF